ncbi:MAG: hypothetical protein ABSG79_05075 [Bryobacteraceae bacterium]
MAIIRFHRPNGTWGASPQYYNDYRWQRRASEQFSLGRNFPIHEKYTLQFVAMLER